MYMRVAFLIIMALVSISAFSQEQRPTNNLQRAHKAMQIVAELQMKRYGGRIRQPNSENGEIVYVNSQKLIGKEVLEKIVKRLASRFHFIIRISDTDVESSDDRIVIRLEELPRKECVILAPENLWVSVNVRALTRDHPPKAILQNRFEKEALRAFAFVCGGTCSTDPGGLSTIVTRASDLDGILVDRFTPDMDVRICNNMCSTKVRPYRICKYTDAVQEGWAPAPTNAFQQAIWEKVHQVPAKPMKIEFDPKKGR